MSMYYGVIFKCTIKNSSTNCLLRYHCTLIFNHQKFYYVVFWIQSKESKTPSKSCWIVLAEKQSPDPNEEDRRPMLLQSMHKIILFPVEYITLSLKHELAWTGFLHTTLGWSKKYTFINSIDFFV